VLGLLAELPPLPMAALMIGVYNLLQDGADLPQPCYVSVSEAAQSIDLQFPGKQPRTRQPDDSRLERQARPRPDARGLPGSACHHVDMAIVFELVVNFGTGKEAAGAAAELVRRAGHIDVRGVPVPLGEPFISRLNSPAYIDFSVHPRGIGYGGPGPKPDLDPRSLTSDEITRVGHALYDLLRGFAGYRAAVAGWDPESQVDLQDLEADWRNGDPPRYDGLVLADDLCEKWQLGPEWNAFEPGYRWLPYSGSRNLRLPHAGNDLRLEY
jgi:hypothetical protein